MNNKIKYKNVFIKCFNVNEQDVENLVYNGISAWDSVGHINLIDELETSFGIMIEPDDILDFVSYKKGMKILNEKYNVEFC